MRVCVSPWGNDKLKSKDEAQRRDDTVKNERFLRQEMSNISLQTADRYDI